MVPGTYSGFAVSPWDESFYLFRVSETKKMEVGRISSFFLFLKKKKLVCIYIKIKYTAIHPPVPF